MREAEFIRQLVDYFKKNLPKGYTPDSLKFALQRQGYSRTMVDKALQMANEEMAASAPVIKEEPKIVYEVEEVKPAKKSFWKRLFGMD
jgi:hypothetical protein